MKTVSVSPQDQTRRSFGTVKPSLQIPLHRGVYDIDGDVLSGPPPRPLDRLDFRIEDGDLRVNYRDFKAGTPKKDSI